MTIQEINRQEKKTSFASLYFWITWITASYKGVQ